MRGWRRQYDEFAGPRYPGLVAYAQLLTGDRDRADALVASSLRRTFGKVRRLGTDVQVEAEIRRVIVARFLAAAGPGDAAVVADPEVEPGVADRPTKPGEEWQAQSTPAVPDPSLYAPPSESPAAEPRANLHMDSADLTGPGVSQTARPGADEPHSAQPCAERSARVSAHGTDSDQMHAALGMLSPGARAMVVLRHYDGLAPGMIASQLGVGHDEVVKELRASYAVLRAELGITIPDEPDNASANGSEGAYEVIVTPHAGSR